MSWIKTNDWDELPMGETLVVIESKGRESRHVAKVSENQHGHRFIVVGHAFHFDVGDLVAYMEFDSYE